MSLALKIAGTSYTLPEASVRSLVHTVQACQPATLSAQIYASGIPTHSIARDSAIELWVDGVRRFAGTIPKRPLTGYDAQGSYIDLNAVDLLGRLRSITYGRQVLEWTGKTTPAPAEWGFPEGSGVMQVVYKLSPVWSTTMTLFSGGIELIGTDTDGDPLYAVRGESSSAAELARLSAFLSSAHGINLELGTIAGLPTKNTVDEITDLDCLSVLQKCAALRPDATFWIDPSTGTNRLNYITRDNCTAITLDVNDRTRITVNECAPRDDLQVGYLKWRLKWEIVRADGTWYPSGNTSEFGDPAAAPDRRLIRTFHLGRFASSSATPGLPFAWEIPRGAAAAYWAAASVLHYEGQCSVYEPNGVSYAYSLGQVVNFSNWQPGYDTARALVRGVTYDLVARRTSISFGPPDSLTPQDYLSISASSLGSSSPTTHPTDPTTDPSDPSAPGSGNGDLPAQVTGGLAGQYSILSTTGAVQVIEGTATLCGWNEYNGYVSTPPRKYHYKVLSGTLVGYSHQYDCGSGGTTCLYQYSGRVTTRGGAYEPPSCDFLTPEMGQLNDSCGIVRNDQRSVIEPYPEQCTVTYTATSKVVTGNGYCHCDGSTWCGKYTGTATETLTDEDTEQAAIARLGDTWADPVGAGEKKTFYEQRTTGFSFAVRRCRLHGYTWTASIYGLPVKVSIPLYKYPYGGTKPATPTATQEFELPLVQIAETTTGAHGLSLTVYKGKATLPDWELPIEQGYVIEAGNISITLL